MTSRFLIELAHEPTTMDCIHAIEVVLHSGSHFLTKADWGCKDGEHKAWIIVEVENKEQARAIVPPAFRAQAKIVQLNAFSLEEVEQIRRSVQA